MGFISDPIMTYRLCSRLERVVTVKVCLKLVEERFLCYETASPKAVSLTVRSSLSGHGVLK